MALTYVGGTSGTGTGASYTVSLNGTLTGGSNSSPQTGDLILVFIGQSNSTTVTSTCSGNTSGAYPTISAYQNQADTYDANLDSYYRFAGATPDTTLTIARTNNTTYGCATVVQVWRGAHSTTPFNVTPTVAAASNSSVANPAAITPTTAGSMIVYCGHGTQTSTGTAYTTAGTYPISAKGDGSTSDAIIMVAAYTAWTSGSYDPAAFAGSTTTTACAWAALTVVIQPQPVVNYPLTCDSGSYTYTGSSATVSRNRVLTSSSGSYTYTGSSADLTKGAALNNRDLTTNAGAYSLTGSDAVLLKGRSLTASPGSYNVTGSSATILRKRALTANGGSYLITGGTAALLRNRVLTTQAGSYSLTGGSAVLLRGRFLVASSGSYTYTVSDATITYTQATVNYPLTALAGSYTLTGSSASILKSKHVTASSGSYLLTGQQAALSVGKHIQALAGAYVISGGSIVIQKTGMVWPLPEQVLLGVQYGPTGFEYTGTLDVLGVKFNITTGQLIKPISNKVVITL